MNSSRILIIEDKKVDAEVLIGKLKRLGFRELTHCFTSKAAISLLRVEGFDVVIIDKELEDSTLDGIAIAKFIRDNTSTPFVFVTGFHDKATTDQILNVGASNHIVKPPSLHQLKVALHNALSSVDRNNQHLASLKQKGEKIIFFRLRDRTQQAIRYSLIQFIVWSGKIGRIYLSDDVQFEIHMSANDALNEYFAEDIFIRVNKGTIINILNIRSIKKQKIYFKGIEKLRPIVVGKSYSATLRGVIQKHNLREVMD